VITDTIEFGPSALLSSLALARSQTIGSSCGSVLTPDTSVRQTSVCPTSSVRLPVPCFLPQHIPASAFAGPAAAEQRPAVCSGRRPESPDEPETHQTDVTMTCICEPLDGAPPGEHAAYVELFSNLFGVCASRDSALDIAAGVLLFIHLLAWTILFLPQLYLQYSRRSAATISLLYLSFWLLSEVFFLVTALLDRWTWLWIGLRIWRTTMTSLLLLQAIYYKFIYSNEFAPAVEAPFARGNGDYFEQHDVEYEAASMGWPSRKQNGNIVNSSSRPPTGNKSSKYGMAARPWGQSLLEGGGGGTPPREMNMGPAAKSRLPSTHAHLSASSVPRTISPNQSPVVTTRTLSKGSAVVTSSHSYSLSASAGTSPTHALNSSIPSIDNERRRAAYAAQHRGSAMRSAGSTNASPLPPLTKSSSGSAFHTSPTSAFTPIIAAGDARSDDQTFAPQGDEQRRQGGGGGGSAKLFTMALCVMGVVTYGAATMGGSSSENEAAFHHGRALLSVGDASTDHICNLPYNPDDLTAILLRIFSWCGCVFGAISFLPQYMYIYEYSKNTDGLSFAMYWMMIVGNLAISLGIAIPQHNDFLSNRYLSDDDSRNGWYIDQIVVPLLIVHSFNALQIPVLFVLRRKFSKPKPQL
jgi:uncharacterized protein with PQ loop repeat